MYNKIKSNEFYSMPFSISLPKYTIILKGHEP